MRKKYIKKTKKRNKNVRYTKRIFKGGNSTYTAIIVEPRKHKALHYVLQNFLENLDNNWNIIVFHGNLNKEYIENIIKNHLEKYKNRITLKSLNVDNLSISDYNKLFKNKEFYENIPTEIFLVFQTDSLINPKNKNNINKFLQYDYVGAPWKNNLVGNGGFSLRRKSKMIEIIDNYNNICINEDVFFSNTCPVVKINIASSDEARKFSSEQIWDPESFGIHKAWASTDISTIKKTFPEVETLVNLQGVDT